MSEQIRVNYATEKELQKLPGVGPAIAKSIMQYRTTMGNLTTTGLMDIKHFNMSPEFMLKADMEPNPDLLRKVDTKPGIVGDTSDLNGKTQAIIDKVDGIVAQKNQAANGKLNGQGEDVKVEVSGDQTFTPFSTPDSPPIPDLSVLFADPIGQNQNGYVGTDGVSLSIPSGQATRPKVSKGINQPPPDSSAIAGTTWVSSAPMVSSYTMPGYGAMGGYMPPQSMPVPSSGGSPGGLMYTQSGMVSGRPGFPQGGPFGGPPGMLNGPSPPHSQAIPVTTNPLFGFGQWNQGFQGQGMSSGTNGFPYGNQFVPGGQYFGQYPYPGNVGFVQPWNIGQGHPGVGMTYGYQGHGIMGYPGGYQGPGFPGQGQAANQMVPGNPGMQYGPQGMYGNQNQGYPGNYGIQGQQGNPGYQGNQGQYNNPGYGNHGPPGNQGNQYGNQGNQGNQGHHRGNQGNQGGNQGNQGGNQGNQYGNQGGNQNRYGNQGNQGNQGGNQGNPGNQGGNHGNQGQNRNQRRPDRIDSLPKTMRYNGSENWKAFKHKFERYAQVKEWNEQETKDYLCWCLEGKASEFYATILQRNADIDYEELIQKMEKRFGVQEIPETAQVKLTTLKQTSEETIEDWADRVLQLATKAFPDLPDEFMYKQAINRICHGCYDRDAGQYAANLSLTTIEEVIDKIKGYQHNHHAIYDKGKREVREVWCGNDELVTDSGQSVKTCQTHMKPSQRVDESKLGKRMDTLEEKLGTLLAEIKLMSRKLQDPPSRSRSASPGQGRSRSPSPGDTCFHCGGQGHFKRNCPKLNTDNKSATGKKVTFDSSLNGKGSGQEA